MNPAVRALFAGLLVATSGGVLAQAGPYVGGALGQSKLKEWCDTGGNPSALAACEDTDTSWKLLGGYRFNRYIAAEATYIDWGKVTATARVGGQSVGVAADQQSYGIAVVGSVPITQQFALFGKFGLLQTEQQTTRTGASPTTRDRTESEVLYGLGARYALTRNLGVRAEWENTDKLNVSMVSVGIEYSFAPNLIADTVTYEGLYIGGSVGQMKAKGDCPPGFTCDLRDTGWKIFGGYQAHQNLAVEVTYGNWGEITLSTRAGATAVTGKGGISSFGVAALGILPLGRTSLFGKAGLVVTEQEVMASGGGITTTSVDDGAEFHWGLGAMFKLVGNWALRAEWERLHKSELDFVSLGIQYKF